MTYKTLMKHETILGVLCQTLNSSSKFIWTVVKGNIL